MRGNSDGGGDVGSAHKDFGRVPQYLIKRKMELAEAEAVQQEAKEKAWIPPGGWPSAQPVQCTCQAGGAPA
jgi:hypothetical protein